MLESPVGREEEQEEAEDEGDEMARS